MGRGELPLPQPRETLGVFVPVAFEVPRGVPCGIHGVLGGASELGESKPSTQLASPSPPPKSQFQKLQECLKSPLYIFLQRPKISSAFIWLKNSLLVLLNLGRKIQPDGGKQPARACLHPLAGVAGLYQSRPPLLTGKPSSPHPSTLLVLLQLP